MSLEKEISDYINHSIVINDLVQKEIDQNGPLYFFKQFHDVYPTLTQIAKTILAVPAASVSAESLFSQSGLIGTDIRNRLAPETLENLSFLKENRIRFWIN